MNDIRKRAIYPSPSILVCGLEKGDGYSWNTIGYALTNTSTSHNDSLLLLSEIVEDSKKTVETCAYSIANGRGRLQGAKEGSGNRPEVRFRVLAVSSGEMTLKANFLYGEREAMAGQIVRCPSIPHKLETSHGFDSFKAFANHLNNAVVNSYEQAGRAFIDKLMQDRAFIIKRARTLYDEFLNTLNKQHTMTAQMSRTVRL